MIPLLISELVKVHPRSRVGKNRVAEHGKIWKVRKLWLNKVLLESTNGEEYCRWVDGDTDCDFEILRTVQLGALESD